MLSSLKCLLEQRLEEISPQRRDPGAAGFGVFYLFS